VNAIEPAKNVTPIPGRGADAHWDANDATAKQTDPAANSTPVHQPFRAGRRRTAAGGRWVTPPDRCRRACRDLRVGAAAGASPRSDDAGAVARAYVAPMRCANDAGVMRDVMDDFTLVSRAADARTQLVVAGGAVGLPEARRLEGAVIEGLAARRTSVVLDLVSVSATGPGLLGVLLRIRRGITGVGGRLVLVVAGPPVSELVATSLLARLIDVAPDRERAIELIAAGP
jgi:hypothetical protein